MFDLSPVYDTQQKVLTERGQQHTLRWWNEVGLEQRIQLLEDLDFLDWRLLDSLIESHVKQRPRIAAPDRLRPARVYPHEPGIDHADLYARAREKGAELLKTGKVAAFTVAGGQGTRLGVDGPKGCVPVTPVGSVTLFELFAQMLVAARRRYQVNLPWYIMTSPANHEETVAYFDANESFGLPKKDVHFFPQGMLPAFDFTGRLLLSEKHRLALAPDGHGGSLKAIVKSGALRDMRSRGIEIVSYFQVDNPMVIALDPLFIGLHALTGSEMSTKVSTKVDDLERVGNVCEADGRVTVIEYSDFPEDLARARNPDGTRKFDAGNLAMHLLSVAFIDRVVGQSFQMPVRRAEKAVPFIDDSGVLQRPTTPNAVKLETFVFDVLPLARNPLVLEVDRTEEFSPVKNATGVDSLDTAKRDQTRRACRWLESAGVRIPRQPNGEPDCRLTIAPTFALDADELAAKRDQLPPINAGDQLYLR